MKQGQVSQEQIVAIHDGFPFKRRSLQHGWMRDTRIFLRKPFGFHRVYVFSRPIQRIVDAYP